MNATFPTYLLSLVEDPTIWEQGKKDSPSRDKQYDLVFFLMYNRFLNYKVFPQKKQRFSGVFRGCKMGTLITNG